jgi:putative transposase
MPRANRYIVPGQIYHLRHRCHNRQFLLKFANDRHGYRRRLREAVHELRLSLLRYTITSNHVHLVAYAVLWATGCLSRPSRHGLEVGRS